MIPKMHKSLHRSVAGKNLHARLKPSGGKHGINSGNMGRDLARHTNGEHSGQLCRCCAPAWRDSVCVQLQVHQNDYAQLGASGIKVEMAVGA